MENDFFKPIICDHCNIASGILGIHELCDVGILISSGFQTIHPLEMKYSERRRIKASNTLLAKSYFWKEVGFLMFFFTFAFSPSELIWKRFCEFCFHIWSRHTGFLMMDWKRLALSLDLNFDLFIFTQEGKLCVEEVYEVLYWQVVGTSSAGLSKWRATDRT